MAVKDRRKLLGRDHARRWNHRNGVPDGVRRHVLIEEPDVAEAFASWCLLDGHGYAASWCPGPVGPPRGRCPLVESGRCGLVEDADLVVTSLGLHREPCRDVVAAIRAVYPEKPVVIEAPQQLLERWAPLFGGCWTSMRMPVTGRILIEAVDLALASPGADGPEDRRPSP
jgi:hypothetical protein